MARATASYTAACALRLAGLLLLVLLTPTFVIAGSLPLSKMETSMAQPASLIWLPPRAKVLSCLNSSSPG